MFNSDIFHFMGFIILFLSFFSNLCSHTFSTAVGRKYKKMVRIKIKLCFSIKFY